MEAWDVAIVGFFFLVSFFIVHGGKLLFFICDVVSYATSSIRICCDSTT